MKSILAHKNKITVGLLSSGDLEFVRLKVSCPLNKIKTNISLGSRFFIEDRTIGYIQNYFEIISKEYLADDDCEVIFNISKGVFKDNFTIKAYS